MGPDLCTRSAEPVPHAIALPDQRRSQAPRNPAGPIGADPIAIGSHYPDFGPNTAKLVRNTARSVLVVRE